MLLLLFCSAATHQTNFKKLFLKAEPGDFSCIAYLSSMLFLTIFGEVMFQLIKINWKCVFILVKIAHGTDVWNHLLLRLVHLCKVRVFENCSIRLSNDWNHFYETTDHLQQFRTDKFSTFFKSEAFTFSSASYWIKFIQLWLETLQDIERFSRPFCLLHLLEKWFLFFDFL